MKRTNGKLIIDNLFLFYLFETKKGGFENGRKQNKV